MLLRAPRPSQRRAMGSAERRPPTARTVSIDATEPRPAPAGANAPQLPSSGTGGLRSRSTPAGPTSLFVDGSVHFLYDYIPIQTLYDLANRDDGNVVWY